MIGNRVAVSKIIDDVLFTHKVPLVPRDIHNLRAKMQKEKAAGRSIEGQVWAQLQKMVDDDAGAHFSAFAQDGIISIIFFQTSHMRRLLQTYPEVLFIDTTYCLNAYKYPVVVFMVVDGDNKGHCVGYSIVRDERLVTFAVIFHEFILKNDFLKSNLKTVVVDKDASEIGAIKLAMPRARVLLCRFHVRKALNANVDSLCAKSKREEMKETVRKLVWTDKEEKFMEAYDLLVEGSDFKTYFDTNWMVIRDHWANYLTKHLTTWGNKTTNFVERHNRALKTVGSSKLGLADFITKLLAFHSREQSSVRRRLLTLNSTTKVYRPQFQAAEPILVRANRVLLPYACQALKSQLDLLHKKILVFDNDVLYEINADNVVISEHTIIDEKCECAYFNDKNLPCWHILGYQQVKNIDFLTNIHERFYKHTLTNALEIDVESLPSSSGAIVISNQASKKTDLQKRHMLLELSRELVSVGVMCGQNDFDKRVEFLNKVVGLWRNGKEISTDSLKTVAPCGDLASSSPTASPLPDAPPSPPAGPSSTVRPLPDAPPSPPAGPSSTVRPLPDAPPSPPAGPSSTADPSSAAPPLPVAPFAMPASNSVDNLVFSFLGQPINVTRIDNSSLDAVFENKVKTKGRRKGEGKTVATRKRKGGPSAPRKKKMKLPRTICGICRNTEFDCSLNGDVRNDCLDWIDCDECKMTFHCLCVGFSKAPRTYKCRACTHI